MTNRDFFRLMIKLFGVYQFTYIIFSVLPANISFLINDSFSSFSSTISLVVVILLTLGIFYFTIKFPDKIIHFFKLDKGFDSQNININNFNKSTVLEIGFVFIGGFLIVDNLSVFVSNLILYFKQSNSNNDIYNALKDTNSLIFSGINLILGFLLITFRKQLSEKF